LLVVVAGLVVNAQRFPSRQFKVAPIEAPQINAEAVAETLADVLAVPTYSDQDRSQMDARQFVRLHAILTERFPNVHAELEREVIGGMTLLYRWPGEDETRDPILLMSHLDVVPVEESSRHEWLYPYDDGTIAEGFVWGRGALDVKCGVVGILAAVEHLLQEGFSPRQTIYLAFGHDEEIGGAEGNAVIAQRFAEDEIRLACVFDEGGAILDGVIPGAPKPVAFVAIAEKSSAHLEIVARGEGGHGSMPGRSAVVNLTDAVHRIHQEPMPARITEATSTLLEFLAPEMPLPQRTLLGNRWLFDPVIAALFSRSPSTSAVVRPTINVTQLITESRENQTPTIARATLNARLLPGDSAEDVCDYVLSLTEDIVLHNGEPAIACEVKRASIGELVSPVDCPEFETLQRTIHEVFPDVLVAAGLTSVGTDSKWYYDVTDKIYRFIPMRVTPEDVARIHGINERIGVENMAEVAQFYVQLIRNLSAVDS